jgi:hypothetical protein
LALASHAFAFSASGEDRLTPPPYVLIGFDTIVTGVTCDEAVIRKALPAGVVPAKEMTGGINIYTASGGFGPGAFSAAYFWVDLEGMDSSDGTKGRWMLAGVYGPSQKATTMYQEYFGFPIHNGSARHEPIVGGIRAVGTFAGQEWLPWKLESTPPSVDPAAAR